MCRVTRHVTPTEEQVARLASGDGDGPIVMVNLLRFKDRVDGGEQSGAESYARYAAAVEPLLRGVGGRVVATTACVETVIGPEDERWDLVALVEYPSRQAFLEMVQSPDYLAAHEHRDAALADSRLVLSTAVESGLPT